MMPRSLSVLFVPFALAACGGSTSPSSSSSPSETPGPSSSSPAPSLPTAPATTNDGSTIAFHPTKVEATRSPFHAGCNEKDAPFTDDDVFTLQPVAGTPDKTARISSIAISFQRNVTVGSPVELTIGGPVRGGTFGDGKMQAHATDDRIGPDVLVLHGGFADGTPPASPLAKATVTVLAVATKDGDPLAARVALRFADGEVLDATYVGSLKSYEGACGGGRP
jgi:hypothetical protein